MKWQRDWAEVVEKLIAYGFEKLSDTMLRDDQDGGVLDAERVNATTSGVIVKFSGGFDFETVTYNAEVLWHSGTYEYAGFLETNEGEVYKTMYAHGFEADIVKVIEAVEAMTGFDGRGN